MKKKVLAAILAGVMCLSMIACGKTDKAETTSEAKTEEAVEEASEDVTEDEALSEEEDVILTADTIDKYFGFKYAKTAPDAMSGVSFEGTDKVSEEVTSVKAPVIPMRYGDAIGVDANNEGADEISNALMSKLCISMHDELYYDQLLPEDQAIYEILQNQLCIDFSGGWDVFDTMYFPDTMQETHAALVELNAKYKAIFEDNAFYIRNGYAYIMMPNATAETLNSLSYQFHIAHANMSDTYISSFDSEITAAHINFKATEKHYYDPVTTTAGGGLITADSLLTDVVDAVAPTSGTINDKNQIELTWECENGTVVTATFDQTTLQVLFVDVTSADAPVTEN